MTQPTDGAPRDAARDAEPTTPTSADGEPTTPTSAGAEPPSPMGAGSGSDHSSVRTVQYKGAELDGERGPGLGCFRFQLVVLVTLLVVTPIGVSAGWPDWLTTVLLFATLALLLVAGQTIIFLLRLVAADRRGRRRPLASPTRTIGELDDAARSTAASTTDDDANGTPDGATDRGPDHGPDQGAAAADGPRTTTSADDGDGDRSVRQ